MSNQTYVVPITVFDEHNVTYFVYVFTVKYVLISLLKSIYLYIHKYIF